MQKNILKCAIIGTSLLISTFSILIPITDANEKSSTNLTPIMPPEYLNDAYIKYIISCASDQSISISSKRNGNILLSANNPNNDDNSPRIVKKNDETQVVIYEKTTDSNLVSNPIIFSSDYGQNWTQQFDVSSTILNGENCSLFSGVTKFLNLVYNANVDVFYYSSIDTETYIYNNILGFFNGDIEHAEKIKMWATCACGDDYLENAATSTNNFFVSLNVRDGYYANRYLDLSYFTYPDFEKPPVLCGFYIDDESVHKTRPASNIEMDTGNRIYLVVETNMQDGAKITVKSTTADEDLLTNGELQNGMDKYADLEQWPGEYLGRGSDPDVSAYGNNVYVVYIQNNNLICKYSTAESGYDPKFDWKESVISTGNVSSPVVYANDNKVICSYIKNNNLYITRSEDGGASWENPSQINEVNGTVVNDFRSIDVNDVGVVWTDIRNGEKDVYYQTITNDCFKPKIALKGGLGITILIENQGNLSMNDIGLKVNIDAPFWFMLEEVNSSISLDSHEAITIILSPFGLGKIDIEIYCKGGGYSKASGYLLGPFIAIK